MPGLRAEAAGRVLVSAVIRLKIGPNLDVTWGRGCRFELDPSGSRASGRVSLQFGTVRPRVRIPGPRPIPEYETQNPRPVLRRFRPWRTQGGHRAAELWM